MDAFGPFRAILILYLVVFPYCLVNSDISCTVVLGDYCKFTLGGDITGTIDLSPVFSNGALEVKNGDFSYQYDACKGVACDDPCTTDPCAACLKTGNNNGIGDIKTVSCDASQSNSSQKEWIIKLSYTGGTDNRKSDFTFMYSPHDTTPEMTFDREYPALDYHLTIIAKFDVPGGPSTLSCTAVPGDPCKCTLSNGANGTIDLSPLFSNGPLTTADVNYLYTYDGCIGVKCEESCMQGTCAACQSEPPRVFGLGALSTVEFNVSRSDPSREIWIVEAVYRGGTKNRTTNVRIEYVPNMPEPKFIFQSESPEFQYNMGLFGTFLVPGGSGPGLACHHDLSSQCKCNLNDSSGSIDFSPVFSQGPLNVTFGNYKYVYDACKGVVCQTPCDPSTQKCAACQDEVASSYSFGLGTLESVRFDVSKSEPSRDSWIVSLSYSGGASGKQFDVLFTHIPSTEKVDFQFLGENPSLSYHFAVYATFDVPRRD